MTQEEVWQKFVDLAETHFVQRCPEVSDAPKTKVPSFTMEPQHLYNVPSMDVDCKYMYYKQHLLVEDMFKMLYKNESTSPRCSLYLLQGSTHLLTHTPAPVATHTHCSHRSV